MDSSSPQLDSPKYKSDMYVRTFAGDMETLKKGGVPNLAPLPSIKAEAEQQEHIPSEIPHAHLHLPTPPQIQTTPKPPLAATQQAAAHIETYESDFLDMMKEKHASTATVLAAEQDSLRQTQVIEKKSRSNLIYIISGIMLLISGGLGAYFAYTHYLASLAIIIAPSQNTSAPIFVDDVEQISGHGVKLIQAIQKSVDRPLSSNTVRLLYIASTTTSSVFSSLPVSAPDVLLRNINTEDSMAGVVNAGGSQNAFFILSVLSYSSTFAGMLAWESVMPRSLSALFPEYQSSPVHAASSSPQQAASTTQPTATTTRYWSTQSSFRDEVVSNHDVRTYRDSAGHSIILYGYWNQTTLVIARDPSAFIEILQRLATKRAR